MDYFFWSSASVKDVREVRPCRQKNEISGLLFLYSDGRLATLSQVRLNQLDAPLIPKDAQKLYLGFKATAQDGPYVARAEILAENPDECTESTDDGVSMWFQVSWSGTLDWWLSCRQCQVYQDGRRSLGIALLPRSRSSSMCW